MKIIRISAIWCSSCLVTYKSWNMLKEKYPNYEYIEYDYDMDVDMIEKYQVGNIIPVIIILDKNGGEIDRIVGEQNQEQIFKIVEKLGG